MAQAVSARRGAAKTRLRALPRLTATLSRSRESTKSRPRVVSSAEEAVMDTSAIAASCPWNLSTVPTRMPGHRDGRSSKNFAQRLTVHNTRTGTSLTAADIGSSGRHRRHTPTETSNPSRLPAGRHLIEDRAGSEISPTTFGADESDTMGPNQLHLSEDRDVLRPSAALSTSQIYP